MSDYPFIPKSNSKIMPPFIPKPKESLEAENARLKSEVKRLCDQRAKLIKSAEDLFQFVGVDLCDSIEHFEAAWEAAKGNPPPDDIDFQEQQDIRLNR